jgi:hypothetical protein
MQKLCRQQDDLSLLNFSFVFLFLSCNFEEQSEQCDELQIYYGIVQQCWVWFKSHVVYSRSLELLNDIPHPSKANTH